VGLVGAFTVDLALEVSRIVLLDDCCAASGWTANAASNAPATRVKRDDMSAPRDGLGHRMFRV
jgi:hypothetical protein